MPAWHRSDPTEMGQRSKVLRHCYSIGKRGQGKTYFKVKIPTMRRIGTWRWCWCLSASAGLRAFTKPERTKFLQNSRRKWKVLWLEAAAAALCWCPDRKRKRWQDGDDVPVGQFAFHVRIVRGQRSWLCFVSTTSFHQRAQVEFHPTICVCRRCPIPFLLMMDDL